MTLNIASILLKNQQIALHECQTPTEIVSWFGALKAQDFAAAKWAIALRSKNLQKPLLNKHLKKGKSSGLIL